MMCIEEDELRVSGRGKSMRYHINWGTYGSWLPGDPRGFRTRRHRMHVEGNYRNPPPVGVYEGLHEHVKANLRKPPIALPDELRPAVGCACLEQFEKEGVCAYALSVGGEHVHAAVDCSPEGLKQMVGRVKKVSSHRIRDQIPGKVWSGGCKPVVVRDEQHWRNVLKYIRDHAPQAWVWVRDGT
ncbi:MAG: transposase [Phycisphaerae bacterium]